MKSWLKLGVSAALLAYVLWVSRPGRIVEAIAHADMRLVAAAVGVWGVIQLLTVYKWAILMRAQGMAVPFGRLLDVYFVGMFFNAFLPTGFGGDAARAHQLATLSGRAGSSVASVGVDRFVSLYSLLLTGTIALAVAPPAWRVVPVWAAVGLDVAGAAAFAVMLHGAWLRRLAVWPPIARRARVALAIEEIAQAMGALRSLGPVCLALGVSLGYQVLAVAMHALLIAAMGLTVPFGFVAVFCPLLTLASAMPFTVNGIGVREGGMAYFLGQFGATPGAAVSVGLLSLGMLLLSAAWGAVRYARLARPART